MGLRDELRKLWRSIKHRWNWWSPSEIDSSSTSRSADRYQNGQQSVAQIMKDLNVTHQMVHAWKNILFPRVWGRVLWLRCNQIGLRLKNSHRNFRKFQKTWCLFLDALNNVAINWDWDHSLVARLFSFLCLKVSNSYLVKSFMPCWYIQNGIGWILM